MWRPTQRDMNNAHGAGVSWCSDKRSDISRNPFLYQLVSNTLLNRYNIITKWQAQASNPGLGGTFGAGATCEFAPSRALEWNIGVGSTSMSLITSTAMTSVGTNMLANRWWSGDYGYKIRVIGISAGKIEERFIVGNTAGTTPTIYLDKPLTFVPTSADKYEILWGAIYMLGAGAIAATSFRSLEVAANALTSLSNTNLPATIGTDSYMIPLDEQYTPYNIEPGSGMLQGNFLYDSWTVTDRYALRASAAWASTLTGQVSVGAPTISNGAPAVITLADHKIKTGHPVMFTTGGTLPTGIVANQVYYATVIDANTFKISVNEAMTEFVNTSSAGSGTHSLWQWDSLILANEYRNYQIRIVQDITTPASVGQRRIIASHTAWPTPVYTLGTAWTTTPSSSAKYVIELPNLMLLRSTATSTLYVYNYNKETINNGTNNILANAWSTTYFGTPSWAVWAWCMLTASFGIQPDPQRNARHSVVYNIRWGNTTTIDALDIAGAINGSWSAAIVYDGNQVNFNTGASGDYSPIDNEGRMMYVNPYTASVNSQILRFDVKNRVLSPYTPTSMIQSGTAAVGNRIATYAIIKSTTEKYTAVFLQAHLSAAAYELITQI